MELKDHLLPPHPLWLYYLAFPVIAVGLIMMGIGIFLCLVWIGVLIGMARNGASRDFPLVFAGVAASLAFLVGSILNLIGRRVFIKGNQFLSIREEHGLIRLFDPKVIYLRSFDSEKQTGQVVSSGFEPFKRGVFRLPDVSTTTEERILSSIFRYVGTPVAIGQPGERLPATGCPRIYLGEGWEGLVSKLIKEVDWVIFRVADSDGVWKEMEMVIQHKKPERIVLIVPYAIEDGAYKDLQSRLEKAFPREIPYVYGLPVAETLVSGLIYFDSDWNATVIKLSEIEASLFLQNPTANLSVNTILETAFLTIPEFRTEAVARFNAQNAQLPTAG